MKKSTLLPFALPLAALMLSATAHAGPDHKFHGPKPGGPDRFIEAIDKRAGLALTDSQKQQIDKVLSEERAKHEAIRKDSQARIDKVLTPEQRAKRDQFLKDSAARQAERLEQRAGQLQERAERLKDGPPPPPPAR